MTGYIYFQIKMAATVKMLVFISLLVQPCALSNDTTQWAFNMTEHILNKTHQMLIMDQLLYCTSQRLCSIGNVKENRSTLSCCVPCSCEDTCVITGSCCIDKALAGDSLDVLYQKGSSCVLSQLKPFEENGLNTMDHYLMIGDCQKTFVDENIARKCRSGNVTPTDVTNYLPVSSVRTNETYRNRYCGYCNWEHDKDLINWKTSFSCRGSQFVFPHQARELFSFIINEDGCNLFYHPPDVPVPFPCEDETYMYTECNVTGLWTEYNRDIDWACRHYRNTYEYADTYYKNVFCYICNTNASIIPSCVFGYTIAGGGRGGGINLGLTSFAALFNFIQDSSTVQAKDTTQVCAPNFLFDTYKNICREITCSPPFRYSNGVCENAFSNVASQRYEMFLRFNTLPSYHTNCDLCLRLTPRLIQEYVKTHLILIGYYKYVCGLTVLFPSNNCSSETIINTDYLVIHVELFVQDYHDPKEVAENLLDTSALHIESGTNTGPLLCTDLKPEVVGGNFYEFESSSNKFRIVFPLDRQYRDPSNGDKMNIETYDEISYCPFKPWVSRLVPTFLCPHVNISLNDYNVTRHSNKVCFDMHNSCFQPEKCIFSDDMSSVLICADTFFASHLPDNIVSREEDLGKVLVSLVCSSLSVICLIVTMVTYILFPVLRTLPGLFTMALCATLTVAHVLFTFGAGAVKIGFLCEVFGITIHLTMLASVFIMNVCSIHMFRVFNHLDRQYVLTEEEKRRHFVISLVYSYGGSALFVLGRSVYSVVTNGRSGYGIRICFINDTNALLYSFTLPVMVLVVANIVMFCIVIVKVSQLPDMSRSSTCRHHSKRFLIYVKLSTLTGVAWLFGFIAEIFNQDVFVYLFIVLLAGQGVFIMLSFVCNKRVYELYIAYKKRGINSSRGHTILDPTLSNSSVSQSRNPHTKDTTLTEVGHDKSCLTVQDNHPLELSSRL
ncbi:uncharacterized protein LOC117325290 [Pecten maximus]|uniref:uncharacterized protein LOC117325290 n=1 Tax=Pecten maximus TaxID=6579 RepID=UPI0014590337|nr:uncharacterized protein LOC117325290 [Pecten maximus]